MKKQTTIFAILFIFASFMFPATLEERIENISKAEMQSVVEFLSHDLVEGRAPGTRGGNLSELYMKTLFKFMNLEPGADGKYLQPFKLQGFTAKELELTANNVTLNYIEDIVGTYARNEAEFELEADAVFIGFGIATRHWKWDDYKGVDIKDKFVITRVNDPGLFRPDKFDGKTLTYYGRWTYHIEEAARRGAAGILLIHTDRTAGYGWKVVKNSWAGEDLLLESDTRGTLKFRGWIKEDSLKKILRVRNIDIKELYRRSLKKKFKPMNLGFSIKVKGKNSFREVLNHNVVAEIPGKSKKRIVISAHIDHFGIKKHVKGDNIFNGAIDNGTAVAAMVMTAKILKEFQKDLYYTVTVLACNAEEAGLLGSKYYVRHTNKENIITNINFESTPVWEKARSIMGIGARYSTIEDMLQILARKNNVGYSYFSMSEQGFFFRSDQFPFAQQGIPSVWLSAGEDDESGQNKYLSFWKETYHTVKDEYDPAWELGGLKQTIKFGLLLIDHINRTREVPRWKRKLTFPTEGVGDPNR
ncbi:MAG: M28 family peptidase [Candidatus Aminicenantes bacterium]|nr:M28 family peptidase [Candidatus Aminicenantes bacterium]